MDIDLTSSLSIQSYSEISNEFQDLQELYNDCKDQDLTNSLYEFPDLDDISFQPQINNDSIEILSLSDVDFPIYDDHHHQINRCTAMETTPYPSRISSLSSNSSMVVDPVEPLSNVFQISTGFASNIPDYSRLLHKQEGNIDVKHLTREKTEDRNQKKLENVRGKWTLEEDRLLCRLVEQYGLGKWSQIAQFLKGRIGKQCRERWHNHLRPNIKKDFWTEEEDRILISAHIEIGNKWAEIAKYVPGRTENSIKNRWNATKRRQFSRKRTHASKYPKSSTLLQNYIKSLGMKQENQLTTSSKNNSLQPLMSINNLHPLTRMNSFQPLTRFNSLQPLTNFNKMNDFYTAPPLHTHRQYGVNGLGKRDDYGVKMEWDTITSCFNNGKMEMDLVEMINRNNKPCFNNNSLCSF